MSKIQSAKADLKKYNFQKVEDNGNGFVAFSHPDLDSHYQLAMNDENSNYHSTPIMIRCDKNRGDGDFGVSQSVKSVDQALSILKHYQTIN